MNTKRVPKNHHKRRVWVKAMLELRGYTYASIARELGVVRSAVRKPLDTSYPKMERILAEKLGLKPEQIWPERYPQSKSIKQC